MTITMLYYQRLQDILSIFVFEQTCIGFPANLESRFLYRLPSKTPRPSHSRAFKTLLLSYLSIYSQPSLQIDVDRELPEAFLHFPHNHSPSSPLGTIVTTSLHRSKTFHHRFSLCSILAFTAFSSRHLDVDHQLDSQNLGYSSNLTQAVQRDHTSIPGSRSLSPPSPDVLHSRPIH